MIKHTFLRDVTQKSRLYLGLIKAQRTQKPAPLIMNLYITGRCNAVCDYCYVELVHNPEKEVGREFTLDEWKTLIDDLYARGTRFFALVGGEPLLYPHIDELVEHIAAKNVFLNLTTNGYLIHKHIDAARKATEVSVSLDGDQVSNDRNRGKRNFELAVAGIDYAVKNGAKVRICTTVTRHNFDQIDFLVKFAEERNIYISFTPINDAPDVREEATEGMRLSSERIREFFARLKEAKDRSPHVINSYANMDYMINYPIRYGDIIWRDGPHANYYTQVCPYGRFQYLLSSTGEIFPCLNMWNNKGYFTSKNIFDDGLDATLEHASYQNLKCQCCSFANGADWNSVTTLPWLLYGLKMTLKQAFIKPKILSQAGQGRGTNSAAKKTVGVSAGK